MDSQSPEIEILENGEGSCTKVKERAQNNGVGKCKNMEESIEKGRGNNEKMRINSGDPQKREGNVPGRSRGGGERRW